MIDIAKKHQTKIAKQTLRMTPATAAIMGGMTFEEAYQFIFNTELMPRLEQLVEEHQNSNTLAWELKTYGWSSPMELLNLLK